MSTAEQIADILDALKYPPLRDLRERIAKAVKAAGASQVVVDAALAVPLEMAPVQIDGG